MLLQGFVVVSVFKVICTVRVNLFVKCIENSNSWVENKTGGQLLRQLVHWSLACVLILTLYRQFTHARFELKFEFTLKKEGFNCFCMMGMQFSIPTPPGFTDKSWKYRFYKVHVNISIPAFLIKLNAEKRTPNCF